ncbi:hypothetical protein [Streptomyces sclerotialus]|uniref:hypothetical protein n=1 Tax=Streptomyces sclerotialus TaxID=1957 RepID=UPI000A7D6CFA
MRAVLLFLLYYLVVTPAGLLVRVFHDPLHRARQPHRNTYWIPSTERSRTRKRHPANV